MRAVQCNAWGELANITLAEVPPPPPPGPGKVAVEVAAAGVNFADILMITGKYQERPMPPFTPGLEVAGRVSAVGAGVQRVKPGDRVLAMLDHGGFAEKVVARESDVFRIPDGMGFAEAAGFAIAYGTSHGALVWRAALKPGELLLVLGAAGGVGVSAVELGKAYGARVIAAVSSPEKLEFARRHGADDGVVYPKGPFDKAGAKALADVFKKACGENGADVIYDPVGGDYSEASLRAIAWEGRLLVVGFPAGIPKLPLNLTLLKSCQVVGVFWGAFARRDPKANAANLAELMRLYDQGKIKPVVSERFPLARAGEAIAKLAARKAMGKIVVTME